MDSDEKEKPKKGNICGIIGLCTFWIPIIGFVLGIVALTRQEDTPALGILAIVLSMIVFVISFASILTSM